MKTWKRWLCALLAAALCLGAPMALADSFSLSRADRQLTMNDLRSLNNGGETIYVHDGCVTMVEGTCTAGAVRGEEDAAQVVASMTTLLGGDNRTQFRFWRTLSDSNGNIYYVFRQMFSDITIPGGVVKVATDSSGRMTGLISSMVQQLPDLNESNGISAEAAERIVVQQMLTDQQAQVTPVSERTEKTILSSAYEGGDLDEASIFVWIVYTNNPKKEADAAGLPYLAHYVTMEGEYLFNMPAIIPEDSDARFSDSSYAFDFMEPAEYTGKVRMSDGTVRQISLTLMRNTETGLYYLGNLERRILVADCYEFLYNDGNLVLQASENNADWDANSLLSLYNYCRAFDYYAQLGWMGGDGLMTPMLVLTDYCDEHHNPVDNAAYMGSYLGCHLFAASAINDYSQCLDVLAHEFTHCVTNATMTYNAYMNDYGAINEAISDIQGNLCEMLMNDTSDSSWLLAENSRRTIRSMSDPHQYGQPAYTWDLYYQPNVKTPTLLNDRGGVHTNSSLLNYVAYALCERGGMSLREARRFWFAVDCACVPGTDYPQLSEIMPWVLERLGMEEYVPSLRQYMSEVRMANTDLPGSFDSDRALLTMVMPEGGVFNDGNWVLNIMSVDLGGIAQQATSLLGGVLGGISGFLNGDESSLDGLSDFLDMMDDEGSFSGALVKWLKGQFGDMVYYATGAAGQDGRTVRMVCRPGSAVPLLMHLDPENPSDENGIVAMVYLGDRWFNLATLGDENDRTSAEFMDALDNMYSLEDARNYMLYDITGGQICELSANGIEEVAASVGLK